MFEAKKDFLKLNKRDLQNRITGTELRILVIIYY
jgi:hypothetical protein